MDYNHPDDSPYLEGNLSFTIAEVAMSNPFGLVASKCRIYGLDRELLLYAALTRVCRHVKERGLL